MYVRLSGKRTTFPRNVSKEPLDRSRAKTLRVISAIQGSIDLPVGECADCAKAPLEVRAQLNYAQVSFVQGKSKCSTVPHRTLNTR